ncbi:MAG: pyridoxal-dependent decarboxylase [Micavibrio aeruginosavorus]|uniref:ornithine decarboxylase n=1 Tax=Micavibrio aeruginosavorus TaxID=349221 RepID=A0A2W5BWS1_9BACT|nr:MAG: pyridoxal-dependent decarboxylase [Micavibrio aeruginosavorus]
MNHNLEGEALTSSQFTSTKIDNLDAFVMQEQPRYPVSVLKNDVLKEKAEEFTGLFPGRILYAVKCNPDERVLRALIAGGVDSFDCASIGEIELVRGIKPDATIYFMHPIKARESIREAYFDHGIRAFVLDSVDELKKILEETQNASDLTLFVRMAVPKQKVATDFSAKFGAPPVLATELLAMARKSCAHLGLSFHVGTHCLDTGAYSNAVKVAAGVIKASGVNVEALDVGGGFPADLDPANPPPPLSQFISAVTDALKSENMEGIELLCEPGRGMVASGGQLVVRVEARRGDLLYINDGAYGGIFEGGPAVDLPYPSRMIRAKGPAASALMVPFRFAGPTCDSVDMLKGPFPLPEDIREGDFIVLDQLGAYGEVSRTPFNGFDKVIRVELDESAAKAKIGKAA